MRLQTALVALLGVLLVLGCNKKTDDSDKSDKSSAESKKDKKDDDDGDKKKKKKDKGDDDDDDDSKKKDKSEKGGALDLGSVNGWSGYSIKAPKGAKASEDDDNVLITAKNGDAYFELVLSQKKPDLKATKKIQTDDAASTKDKITFTTDSDTALEWTREGTSKSRNFVHIIKVGDDELGCYPNSNVVAEADFNAMKDACDTIAKK